MGATGIVLSEDEILACHVFDDEVPDIWGLLNDNDENAASADPDPVIVDSTSSAEVEGLSSIPSPTDSGFSWVDEIENILMHDDDPVDGLENGIEDSYNDFLSGLICDFPAAENSNSDNSNSVNSNSDGKGSPELETNEVDGDMEVPGEVDDPVSKKRKRQMRNRDAALRSRERKKIYVKDLEMKSKYLEGECRRLGRLLQCCFQENQALRFSLQMGNEASGASKTGQESAVLVLESLLLGSLFWFLGIMCLFNLPKLVQSNPDVFPLERAGNKGLGSAALRLARSKVFESFRAGLSFKSRRCKASRTRMKISFIGLGILA